MCQINQREGTASFAAIRRVLRELFAKNHGGPFDPLQVRGLTLARTWGGVDATPQVGFVLCTPCF